MSRSSVRPPRRRRTAAPAREREQAAGGARRLRLGVGIALLGVAALGLALSWLPYESIDERVGTFAVDGDGELRREEFDAVILRLRVVAAGLGVAALGLLLLGATLDTPLAVVLSALTRSLGAAPRLLWGWLAREPVADLVALAIASSLALGARIAYLDVPLRYDEATTYVSYVSKPLYVGLSNYSAPNNHLLHTAVAKLSVVLFGTGSTALRLPALVAGVALVPLTFALGRVLYGRAAALLAAAFVASSSTLIEYSVNARGYTIVAGLTLVALLAAVRVVDGDSLPAWAALTVVGAIGLYAVPVMLYATGGILLWIAVSQLAAGSPARRVARRVAASALVTVVLTGLLYAPVAIASGPRSVTSNEFVAPSSWLDFVDRLPGHVVDTAETWGRDVPFPLDVLFALLLVLSLLLTPRISRYPVPPLAAVVAWSLPVLVAQRVVPFTRVWVFAVPLAAVTVAGLVGHVVDRARPGRLLGPLAAIAVATAGTAAVLAADSPRLSRETGGLLDAPAVARYLGHAVEPDDRILATGSDTILQYYLDTSGVDSGPLLYSAEARRRIFVVVNVLGDQTVGQLVEGLGEDRELYDEPRLLRRWPSAAVHLLERRAPAATR